MAGNHGRFLFDFSPELIVFRVTTDPAPRILYCFDTKDDGHTVNVDTLHRRIESGDIDPKEIYIGVSDLSTELSKQLKEAGATVAGVKATAQTVVSSIDKHTAAKA